jgi:hypothetical protein
VWLTDFSFWASAMGSSDGTQENQMTQQTKIEWTERNGVPAQMGGEG